MKGENVEGLPLQIRLRPAPRVGNAPTMISRTAILYANEFFGQPRLPQKVENGQLHLPMATISSTPPARRWFLITAQRRGGSTI